MKEKKVFNYDDGRVEIEKETMSNEIKWQVSVYVPTMFQPYVALSEEECEADASNAWMVSNALINVLPEEYKELMKDLIESKILDTNEEEYIARWSGILSSNKDIVF